MKKNSVKIVVLGKEGQLARSLRTLSQSRDLDIHFFSSREVDLLATEKLDAIFKNIEYDILINTSAYTLVDKAEIEKDKAYVINALSVKKLAEITKDKNAKLIHFSTDYVYGDKGSEFLSEESATLPLNNYGLTKLQGENFIFEVGVRNLIFRTSWVFSPWGTNFLKTMLRVGSEREVIKVVSDQIGAPTYALALAESVLSILEKWETPKQDGIYNISGGDNCSWYDFAKLIFEKARQLDFKINVKNLIAISSEEYPVAAVRPINSRMCLDKIKKTFDIRIPTLQENVDDCLKRLKLEK